MACVIVPAAEAVITTIIEKAVKTRETAEPAGVSHAGASVREEGGIRFSTKLGWLNKLLWGGSALLLFEHVWHGEVAPYFPFFTAVESGKTADMLAEMGTAGVAMSAVVTAAWLGMVAVSSAMEKRAGASGAPEFAGEDA